MLFMPLPVAPQVMPHVRPLLLEGRISVPAAVGSFLLASRLDLTGYRAVITGYGVTVRSNPTYDWSGSLAFTIRANDAPLPSLDSGKWTLERGSVAQPLPCAILLTANANLTFLVQRAVANVQADTVDVIAIGFMWPLTVERTAKDDGAYRV